MNSAKHLGKNVSICLNVLWVLVLSGSPHYVFTIMPTSLKKAGAGASSVSSDPSNDKDKEGNNPSNPKIKDSKSQNTSNCQTKQGKDLQNQSKQKDQGKSCKKKVDTLGGYAGRVMVGDKRQPICILAGMSKVVVDRTQDKLPRGSYMVEATDNDNLPCGISVNHTYVSPHQIKASFSHFAQY